MDRHLKIPNPNASVVDRGDLTPGSRANRGEKPPEPAHRWLTMSASRSPIINVNNENSDAAGHGESKRRFCLPNRLGFDFT
jgi:hypothetical protein